MVRFASLTLLLLAACSTAAPADTSESGVGTTFASGTDALTTTLDDSGTTAQGGTSPTTTTFPATGTGGSFTASETTDPGGTTGTDKDDYSEPGAAPVGNLTFTLVNGDRMLPVEVWYPADAAAQMDAEMGHPVEEFVAVGPDRTAFVDLLQKLSPQGQVGTRLQTRSARDAVPSGMSPYPLIVLSHCHNCVRFSLFSIAEHLASRGFVVAAPDHVGNTLFDELKGQSAGISEEFLEVRVSDQRALLDALLDADNAAVPEAIRGSIDPKRIGAMGHSYGAATTGRLAQDDDRVVAALPIAAPTESPFFPKTKVALIAEPTLYVLAVEDNSILQLGNNLIEMNFNAGATPTYLVKMKDTGHWGPSDICGLVPAFNPGCAEGTRMTDGTAFTYLDPLTARAIVAGYAAAFFDLHLNGNQAALEFLQTPAPVRVVEVETRL